MWRHPFNSSHCCCENYQRNLNCNLDFQMPSSETFWFVQIVVLNHIFDFVLVLFRLWYPLSHQGNLELLLPIHFEKHTWKYLVLVVRPNKRWWLYVFKQFQMLPGSSVVSLMINVEYMLQLLQSSGTFHFWHNSSQVSDLPTLQNFHPQVLGWVKVVPTIIPGGIRFSAIR